jgi:hypothetical protein
MDESLFLLFRNKVKEWGKTPQRGPQIMVWGGISYHGCTPIKMTTKTIDAIGYIDTLNECLLETMDTICSNGYVPQQDNARPHTARATQEWLRDTSVTVLKWPAYSPHLNPIEKVWQVMKHRVKMDRRKVND